VSEEGEEEGEEAATIAKTGALLVMVIAALGLGQRLAPSHGTEAFYSAGAEVIPILLLVLALEARLFRLDVPIRLARSRADDRSALARSVIQIAVLGLTLFLFTFGELQALSALASNHPEHANAKNVYTAVLVGLLLVAFMALFGTPAKGGEQDDSS
jgi:hypothetical protein